MANEPEATDPIWLHRLRHELGTNSAWDNEEARFLAADVRAAVDEVDRLQAVLRELAKERERAFAAEERLRRIEAAAAAVIAEVPWTRIFDGGVWRDHPAALLRQELDRPMQWSGRL